MMDQRLSVITIATERLTEVLSFYRDVLGWETAAANKDIIFYKLNGFLLSFCDKKLLDNLTGKTTENHCRNFTISYNVESKQKVLALYEQIKTKAIILQPPTEPPFGGLYFYFADIDGNVIEIACNDFVIMDDEKNVIHHKPIDHL
jgi:catechol 2,3-dioxygenase-like lactoylglutathione lyase family enzyme